MIMIHLHSRFFTMNRILRIVLYPEILLKARSFSGSIGDLPKVKIFPHRDDDTMRICFKYGSYVQNTISVAVRRQEELQVLLSKIKEALSLQRKQEELRRAVVNKYYGGAIEEIEESAEGVDVCLIHNDQLLESGMPSEEALAHGSFLRIGQSVYEVDLHPPTIRALSLPYAILAGCVIRPHFLFDNANVHESNFLWYRSVSTEEAESLKSSESEDVVEIDGQWWMKVHQGLIYWTSESDIGRKLSVVCTPVKGERSGLPETVVSNDVRSRPENIPFEERHLYTKELTGADSIRCLSYNILANIYVERKKFPYCSRLARDVYYRKQLLSRELLGYNSDVLCLQEVQGRIFEYDLQPVLQEAGFDGFYMKKGGRTYEGLACFTRRSKFKVISTERVLLNELIKRRDICNDLLPKVSGNFKDVSKLLAQDSALQAVLLEHADNPKRRILVANTHLYSNKDTPEVRLLQSALCVCYIEHVLKLQEAIQPTSLLFCGDFNSLPDSSALEFLLQGSFKCCSSWSKNGPGSSDDTTLRHCLPLGSACGFPEYTNYTQQFFGCLDYIFYNKNLFTVSEIVPFPSHESVTQHVGLPSELFPSDHIPIICTLKWK